MKATYFLGILLLPFGFLLTIFSIVGCKPLSNDARSNRVEQLFREMTVDPNRQQIALDELMKSEDAALTSLPCYFDDERLIASRDVKFLNTYPGAFEKYFLSRGETVSDVAVQIFCMRSRKCDIDPDKKKEIVKKLSSNSITCSASSVVKR